MHSTTHLTESLFKGWLPSLGGFAPASSLSKDRPPFPVIEYPPTLLLSTTTNILAGFSVTYRGSQNRKYYIFQLSHMYLVLSAMIFCTYYNFVKIHCCYQWWYSAKCKPARILQIFRNSSVIAQKSPYLNCTFCFTYKMM